MRYIKKYNESLSKSSLEEYSSALIKDVILLRSTDMTVQAEVVYRKYEFEILDANEQKNILVFDESFLISPLRKVRVFYPTKGSYLTDINNLREWRKVFEIIESRIANASEHVKKMDLVSKMFDVVTKEVIAEHFAGDKGWDGTYKGNLCQDDIYVYKIIVIDNNNLKHEKTGHVSLLK